MEPATVPTTMPFSQFSFFYYEIGQRVIADTAYYDVFHRFHSTLLGSSDEQRFLGALLEAIGPHRRHPEMRPLDAFQMVQREEELFALLARVENVLMSLGIIPPEDFARLRLHPDFNAEIWPYVVQLQAARKSNALVELRGAPKWLLRVADELAPQFPSLRPIDKRRVIVPESPILRPGA